MTVGLWQRFTMIFKAKASRTLDRVENPGETLDYSYQKQLEMLQKTKRGLADVVTAKKRLQHQTQGLEQSVVKLDGQARQAISAGRDDLARTALERKVLVQEQLQGLDQQIAGLPLELPRRTFVSVGNLPDHIYRDRHPVAVPGVQRQQPLVSKNARGSLL
jgi:phage shock protein A